MSDKMACPSCQAYTSAVLDRYADGEPCPHCGLPAEVTGQVLAARRKAADEELVVKFMEAEKRAAEAERKAAALELRFEAIREALDSEG